MNINLAKLSKDSGKSESEIAKQIITLLLMKHQKEKFTIALRGVK